MIHFNNFIPKRPLAITCYVFLITFLICSCKKFIAVPAPSTELASASVFTDSLTATAAQTVIYSNMAGSTTYTIPFFTGLSADELLNYSTNPDVAQLYSNGLSSSNGSTSGLWAQWYQYIYAANAVLEGAQNSTSLSPSLKNELEGEAKFVRAFSHFYLVNLYGNIPLILTTDYTINKSAKQVAAAQVYQQIIADLKDAQRLLASDFSYGGGERIRPNKWAATALLARVYLYTKDWGNAESSAATIIADGTDFSLVNDLNQVFLANGNEAIWQLKPSLPNENTSEGFFFILAGIPSTVSLTNSFVSSFEPLDQRKTDWVDTVSANGIIYYFPYKYKIKAGSTLTEYSMVLRLSEQYLIRAEAEANGAGGGTSAAINDLNVIRNRAGLPNYAGATDKASILAALLHERQVELFTEWGHRWLDLKRSGLTDNVLSAIKPDWKSTAALYPIPLTELQNDPNLVQNPGY